eukprot:TRINITY_DN2130_c1_g1_i5.p1 TRINITY_DN2130_c1_g1~~TRINITY_DN2130_c1_g1_i5.p1  ORF type:complete len:612 (+),score=108.19 TRINITY_DN2130_c1_g1_i5:48-1883(+)
MSSRDAHKQIQRWLQSIGCPVSFRQDSLEWINEEPIVRNFLISLASNIGSKNVVSVDDILSYHKISSSTQAIEAKAIKSAMEQQRLKYSEIETLRQRHEMEKAKIIALEDKISTFKMQRQTLIQRREKLIILMRQAVDRKMKIGQLQDLNKEKNQAIMDMMDRKIVEFGSVIEQLSSKMNNLVQRMKSSEASQTHATRSILFHNQDLQPYLNEDDRYTRELKTYIQKQFQQGPSAILQLQSSEEYTWFNLHESSKFLVQEDPQDVYNASCKELNRLQNVFLLTHRQNIDANIRLAQVKGQTQKLDQILEYLETYANMSPTQLHSTAAEKNAHLQKLRQDVSSALQGPLTHMLMEIRKYQSSRILVGDYELKIQRQNYHIDKQKLLINLLVDQQSRHLCVAYCLQKGHKTLQGIQRLFEAISQELSFQHDAHQHQLSVGQKMSTSSAPRKTIDSRDYWTYSLFHLLHGKSVPQTPFIKMDVITTQGAHFASMMRTASSGILDAENSLNRLHMKLREGLKTLQTLWSDEKCGHASTSVQALHDLQNDVSSQLDHFSSALNVLIQQRSSETQKIQSQYNEIRDARNLYVEFFLAPDRLRSKVEELEERVKSLHR